MTVLLGPIEGGVELDDTEAQALDALADGGLVPPLRMVPVLDLPELRPGLADDSPGTGTAQAAG